MNLYKNKNPLSHNLNYTQHRYPPPSQLLPPIPSPPPNSSTMSLFTQNLNNKSKYKTTTSPNCQQPSSRKISNCSLNKNNDFDLECDQILTKPKILLQDSQFTCNQTLLSLPRANNQQIPNMDKIQTKRLLDRRQSSNQNQQMALNLPNTIDLQCNEQLQEITNNINKDNSLECIYKKIGSILDYYQKFTIHLQDKICKLEAENQALMLKTIK